MFGLDTISWMRFISLLLLLCGTYYAAFFIRGWLGRSARLSGNLFESADDTGQQAEGLQPIQVSASDYPGELIPVIKAEAVPMTTDFYRDSGLDEGYNVEQFTEGHPSCFPELPEHFQFQK